jgi:RNA polymerase primary sigma factor
METLPERKAAIIEPRFGLNGSTAKTLQQVSELIGLTRERVRQLEIEAIAKFVAPSTAASLRFHRRFLWQPDQMRADNLLAARPS